MKYNIKDILQYAYKNVAWIVGVAVPLYILGFQKELVNSLLLVTTVICYLTGLSGLILYAFTTIKYTRYIAEGDNKKLDPTERYALVGLAGKIFMGVMTAGAVIWAIIYLSQFSGSA